MAIDASSQRYRAMLLKDCAGSADDFDKKLLCIKKVQAIVPTKKNHKTQNGSRFYFFCIDWFRAPGRRGTAQVQQQHGNEQDADDMREQGLHDGR
jgi:hypothetical protein